MKKKLFAFIGSRSPKKITYSFVKKILKEIEHVEPIQYEIMTLEDFNIHSCLGCENCFTKGHCIQHDDLHKLEQKILQADILLFAAPVYMQGLPGEMKNIIDRLATWAHTFRLSAKNVILASTCNSNGHLTVINELHIKLLYMGARIVDKYVGSNIIPDNLNTDANLVLLDRQDEQLPNMVKKTVAKWNTPIESNKFLETLFQNYHNIYTNAIQQNYINGEAQYWQDSGLIDCHSYQEYLNIISNN